MSQETPKKYDFVQESSKRGPIRWTGLIVTVIVGGAAVYYVKQAKDEMEKSVYAFEVMILLWKAEMTYVYLSYIAVEIMEKLASFKKKHYNSYHYNLIYGLFIIKNFPLISSVINETLQPQKPGVNGLIARGRGYPLGVWQTWLIGTLF